MQSKKVKKAQIIIEGSVIEDFDKKFGLKEIILLGDKGHGVRRFVFQ